MLFGSPVFGIAITLPRFHLLNSLGSFSSFSHIAHQFYPLTGASRPWTFSFFLSFLFSEVPIPVGIHIYFHGQPLAPVPFVHRCSSLLVSPVVFLTDSLRYDVLTSSNHPLFFLLNDLVRTFLSHFTPLYFIFKELSHNQWSSWQLQTTSVPEFNALFRESRTYHTIHICETSV